MKTIDFSEFMELSDPNSGIEVAMATNQLVGRMLRRIQFEQAKVGHPLMWVAKRPADGYVFFSKEFPNRLCSEVSFVDQPGEEGFVGKDGKSSSFVRFADVLAAPA